MFSLFSNKKKGVLSIILDIQSGLVRGALVEDCQDSEIDGKVHVLSVVTRSISSKTNIINSEHLTKRILKLVSEVVEHLNKDSGSGKITKVSYVLSSPWIFSKLKTVKIDYGRETEITSKTLSDIVKEEVKNNTVTADIKPIEQKIFEVRLNGYPSTTFEGKKAHTLDVSVSTSFSSISFINKVTAVVNKHTHIKNSDFYSALLLQYTALREILKGKSEFIFIHCHNELTDIVIVKDNLCKHIASFPFGVSTFLRKIANGTGESIESSDSLLSLYQGNKLSDSEKERVSKIVNPLLTEWSSLCLQSFQDIFDPATIPRTVYLAAHSHFDLFKEVLTKEANYNFNIELYDSIDTNEGVVFKKGCALSPMIKIYALALNTVI